MAMRDTHGTGMEVDRMNAELPDERYWLQQLHKESIGRMACQVVVRISGVNRQNSAGSDGRQEGRGNWTHSFSPVVGWNFRSVTVI